MTQSLKMVGLVGWAMPGEQAWRKGPWTPEEDKLLTEYVSLHGEGRWSSVARSAGLNRTGKSCRLRWVNYLRPGLKRGQITPQEEGIIIELHAIWGNKWSTIARYLPGRTDNEIKNYWRTHFKKKERSSRKPSEKRKSQNSKRQPKPQPQTQTQTQESEQANPGQPEKTTSTPVLPMEEQISQQASTQPNDVSTKEELLLMYPTTTMDQEHQSLITPSVSGWMDAAGTCQDQDGGSWWGSLWNFGDQAGAGRVVLDQIQQQQDRYCSKLALSAQNQATNSNYNIMATNNGLSWGADPNHLYNGGYIF